MTQRGTLKSHIKEFFYKSPKEWHRPADVKEKISTHLSGEEQNKLTRKKIHYHLKNLRQDGFLDYDEKNKRYKLHRILDLEGIKEIILDSLVGEKYTETELFLKLKEQGLTDDDFCDAFFILKRDGRIKVEQSDKESETKKAVYSLPISEYSKRNICVLCNSKIDSSGEVLTALYRRYGSGHTWRTASVHKTCFKKPKANFLILNGKYEGDVFCDHCGLPLSPKMIATPMVSHHLLYEHFTDLEADTLEWVEFLFRNFPECSPEELIDFYDELGKKFNGGSDFTPIPYQSEEERKFILSLLGNLCDIHDFWKIQSKIINMVGVDLTRRSWTERLMKDLMYFFPEVPEDYDVNSRIREIWTAAQKLIIDFEKDIQRLYERLLGPVGSIYSRVQPSWVIYDDPIFGKKFEQRGGADLPNKEFDHGGELYSQVITFKEKETGKVYHPYCAEKLGITAKEGGE